MKERRKEPREGSEKNLKPYVYKHTKHVNVRCGTFCRTVRRVIVAGEVKYRRYGAAGKPSMKCAYSQ